MGMDLKSIAVPLHADPVRAIRADPELWASASDQPPFCAPWGDETVPDISRALLAVIPAGTGWVHHFGDRSFHQAEYLLDPVAYRAEARTWEATTMPSPGCWTNCARSPSTATGWWHEIST